MRSTQPRSLTVGVDAFSNAPDGSFLLTEDALDVEGVLHPLVAVEQRPDILVVAVLFRVGGGQIPVKDEQRAKSCSLGKKNNGNMGILKCDG